MKNRNLWIAFGVVIALCLCMGIGGFFMLRTVGTKMVDSVKTDPAEVEQVGAKIADYSVPTGYSQTMAMSILGTDFVFIAPEDASNGALIMLMQFGAGVQGNPEAFQEQMQRSFEQQSGRRGLNMKVVETKTMTIRGQESQVSILEGTDESGTSLRQLLTSFEGKAGTVMVMIQGLTEDWDQDMIDGFLESIH
jgi:hypothetical protein